MWNHRLYFDPDDGSYAIVEALYNEDGSVACVGKVLPLKFDPVEAAGKDPIIRLAKEICYIAEAFELPILVKGAEVGFMREVEDGIAEANRGEFATAEEVLAVFGKYKA